MEDKPSGFPWYPSLLPTQSIVCIEEGVRVRDLTQWPQHLLLQAGTLTSQGKQGGQISHLCKVCQAQHSPHMSNHMFLCLQEI